jgi:hypothetical protein
MYLAYLNRLIEENRDKRNPATSDEAEERYWRERERWHQEQRKARNTGLRDCGLSDVQRRGSVSTNHDGPNNFSRAA